MPLAKLPLVQHTSLRLYMYYLYMKDEPNLVITSMYTTYYKAVWMSVNLYLWWKTYKCMRNLVIILLIAKSEAGYRRYKFATKVWIDEWAIAHIFDSRYTTHVAASDRYR